jgi:hypothetical protein
MEPCCRRRRHCYSALEIRTCHCRWDSEEQELVGMCRVGSGTGCMETCWVYYNSEEVDHRGLEGSVESELQVRHG